MNEDREVSNNIFARLWKGDVGLAKSYWLWGMAAGFFWGITIGVISPVPGSAAAQIIVSLMMAYFVFVYVGIWRAANKYEGKDIWASLAKAAVVIGAMVTILPMFAIVIEKIVS